MCYDGKIDETTGDDTNKIETEIESQRKKPRTLGNNNNIATKQTAPI